MRSGKTRVIFLATPSPFVLGLFPFQYLIRIISSSETQPYNISIMFLLRKIYTILYN